jgi:hypothetical protein
MRVLNKTAEPVIAERRQFLIAGGKVLLVLPAGWVLANCSNTSSYPTMPATPLPPTTNVTTGTLTFTSSITESHSHDFTMTMAEVAAPPDGGISRDTSTTLNHMHVVTLSTAQLIQINAGQTVTTDTSLVQNHLHTFSFSLAGASMSPGADGGSSTDGGAAGTTGSAVNPGTTVGGGTPRGY